MRINSMKTMTFMIIVWLTFLSVLAYGVYKSVISIPIPSNLIFKNLEDFIGKDQNK